MMLDKFLNLKGTSIQGYLHLENIGIVGSVAKNFNRLLTDKEFLNFSLFKQ
jgi:hypothetical protein